jgi:glucose-fructose oxidoreductase
MKAGAEIRLKTWEVKMRTWRVVGISFEHIHMGDLLREVHEHPNAEIAGVCDPDRTRMADAIANFSISPDRV